MARGLTKTPINTFIGQNQINLVQRFVGNSNLLLMLNAVCILGFQRQKIISLIINMMLEKCKFIKFIMRDKSNNFTLPFEQAKNVLESKSQLVMIHSKGQWTGLTVNKADVMMTERDMEAEKEWRVNNIPSLEEPKITPGMKEKIETSKKEINKIYSLK